MKRPELLSPAGNFEKMKAAILYGADAVYLAGSLFGMRAAADNFELSELASAVSYAHERGVKVYVTVNTMPRDCEYAELRRYLEALKEIRPDALIVADVGVLFLVKELIPDMEIHISTQANAVSAAACRAWYELGARRVVLARELTLEEIKTIRRNIPRDLELECFIHGSMCVSYSGRCLLSGHLAERDGNRGMCAQPCRWNYTISGYEIREEKRPNMPLPIEECGGETFILSSKDTCTVEHVPELVEAGIDSFKIEGRMKSAYYTAVVTNAYKMALDSYFSGSYEYDPMWRRELESVSHREYASGYYFSDPHGDPNVTHNGGYIREKAYLAVVVSVENGVAKLSQRNKLSVGDEVEIVSPGRVGVRQVIGEMRDASGASIASAPHPYMEFYTTFTVEVKAGDIIRGA